MAEHHGRDLYKTSISARVGRFVALQLKFHLGGWSPLLSALLTLKRANLGAQDLYLTRLTMNQFRKAACTNPKALHVMPERNEIAGGFVGPTGEALNRNIFLLGLGFCFFTVKFDSVSFFD